MGRDKSGDFHPKINEWGGVWALPLSQGEELGRLPYTTMLILRCPTHREDILILSNLL
jgi:hypothetical protein